MSKPIGNFIIRSLSPPHYRTLQLSIVSRDMPPITTLPGDVSSSPPFPPPCSTLLFGLLGLIRFNLTHLLQALPRDLQRLVDHRLRQDQVRLVVGAGAVGLLDFYGGPVRAVGVGAGGGEEGVGSNVVQDAGEEGREGSHLP